MTVPAEAQPDVRPRPRSAGTDTKGTGGAHTALGLWGLSRLALVLTTVVGGWAVSGGRPGWGDLLERWDQ